MLKWEIMADARDCRDCRMCELACSFHHTGTFAPETASVKIFRDNENGKIKISIDETCDRCEGEPRPLCVKYCMYGVLKQNT